MTEFNATYYDGRTSARTEVRVYGEDDCLRIVGNGLEFRVALVQARVDAPLPGTRRVIDLPDGAQLQTDDHAALEILFPRAHRLEGWVHRLERHWRYALAALAAIVAISIWTATDGLPLAAKVVAGFVPPGLETQMGEQTMASIDKTLCARSKLDASRQEAVWANFGMLVAGLQDSYRIEMRSCPRLGPNAFALPGGTILLTDELVGLAQNDAQLSAVLAHEIGHVRYRHGLRQGLQAAGLAALLTVLTGDAVSITGLAATLPTMLLESGYSRAFEEEADEYALQRLKTLGISPKYFAEILVLLEKHHDNAVQAKDTARGEHALDYLSTHPATARRVERALANQ